MLDQTTHFVEIEDGEMVTVTADAIEIEDPKGNLVYRESYEAQLDLTDIEKEHTLTMHVKEIDDQPTQMPLDPRISRRICSSDRSSVKSELS